MGVVFKGIVSKGIVGGTPLNLLQVDTVGAGSFIVPAGVTSLTVKLWGAGGGSGGNGYIEGGGGGGGGAFASKLLSVTPNSSISFVVGTGGGAGGYNGFGQTVGTSGSATTCSGGTPGCSFGWDSVTGWVDCASAVADKCCCY